jgi:virulence-associated protein VagC
MEGVAVPVIAKAFVSGHSQALRLPAKMRLQVQILNCQHASDTGCQYL